MIPFTDLTMPEKLQKEILDRWAAILQTGVYLDGPYVSKFEEDFAKFVGVPCAVSTSSGSSALLLALQAMDVQPGDEVITVPNTFTATVEAILQCGAKPVFVDVERETGLMDPTKLRSVITPLTKAIVPVHLYGQMANMGAIMAIARRHNLLVCEDACQALGAIRDSHLHAGAVGDTAAFSFYPTKNLGGFGHGGMVTTKDPTFAERVAILRKHGSVSKYQHEVPGYNAAMDEVQAAALDVKMRYLDALTLGRQLVAERYETVLGKTPSIKLPVVSLGSTHVYHLYVVRIPYRGRIMGALKKAEVGCGLHYPTPLHMQEAYRFMGHAHGDFPHAELWAERGLSLPMFPTMSTDQIEVVCSALLRAVQEFKS